MTDQSKACSPRSDVKPLDQFRLSPAGTRHSWCIACEREAARLRAAKRYNTDPEWRLKQLANAALQNTRRTARARERQRSTE